MKRETGDGGGTHSTRARGFYIAFEYFIVPDKETASPLIVRNVIGRIISAGARHRVTQFTRKRPCLLIARWSTQDSWA